MNKRCQIICFTFYLVIKRTWNCYSQSIRILELAVTPIIIVHSELLFIITLQQSKFCPNGLFELCLAHYITQPSLFSTHYRKITSFLSIPAAANHQNLPGNEVWGKIASFQGKDSKRNLPNVKEMTKKERVVHFEFSIVSEDAISQQGRKFR